MENIAHLFSICSEILIINKDRIEIIWENFSNFLYFCFTKKKIDKKDKKYQLLSENIHKFIEKSIKKSPFLSNFQ